MPADISGIWEGTLATETAPAYQAYDGAYGGRREIRQLGGQPAAALYDVKLTITSQDEYRKFGTDRFVTEPLVSTISGQLYNFGRESSTPVSGFVDDTGLVKLIFYHSSSLDDTTFIGRLTSRGLVRDISGNWMLRVAAGPGGGAWTWAWINYYFGTLSVKKVGLSLSDHAYIVDYGHVF